MLTVYEVFVITSVAIGLIAALMAKAKGRDPVRWFAIGALLNIVGLVAVLVVENQMANKAPTVRRV